MENSAQDIDLFDFFKWLRRQFRNFLIYLYRLGRFLLRNIGILAGLMILGFGIGYVVSKIVDEKKIAEIIVVPNVNTTSYLYSKIDQINHGISSKDSSLLAELQGYFPNLDIHEIRVEPIEDISNLLENTAFNSEELLEMIADYDDDGPFYDKPLYTTSYDAHKITMTASGAFATPERLIQFLEADPYLEIKREAGVDNLTAELISNEFTIQQIDSVLQNINRALQTGQQSLSILAARDESNLSAVLESKATLVTRNTEIKEELLYLDSVFKVYTSSKWLQSTSIVSVLKYILPLVFVLLFLFYHALLMFKKRFQAYL